MTPSGASVRAALLEQTERTRRCSKAEIERIIEEDEAEILTLQSQIDALIESRVLALKYIISPIRSMPVELLSEIFDLAIEDQTHVQDAHRILQVCSDWRRVAHTSSTPRLWTRTLDVLRKGAWWTAALKAWLARSAPLPVSILLADEERPVVKDGGRRHFIIIIGTRSQRFEQGFEAVVTALREPADKPGRWCGGGVVDLSPRLNTQPARTYLIE
ncbi:hypothetical protein C8R45DRAFT_1113466 [Mycena sanguinolenta]|nr:hypothetical protein C8R45DRAFT_1113466 [Mycena sanguinolenta]